MKYEELRNKIQDGDLVFFGRPKSIWSRLTCAVTRSEFYHAGFAFWLRDPAYPQRLMLAEASRGGRRVVSLSAYREHSMTVLRAPVFQWHNHADDILDHTGSVPYGFMDYIGIGTLELLNIRLKNFNGEVCSEMMAQYLAHDGYAVEKLVSPGRLFSSLMPMCAKIGVFDPRVDL